MDRIVRVWNPYVAGKPTGMLRGHTAPIFYLFVAEEEKRIFSISTDKCIKVGSKTQLNTKAIFHSNLDEYFVSDLGH